MQERWVSDGTLSDDKEYGARKSYWNSNAIMTEDRCKNRGDSDCHKKSTWNGDANNNFLNNVQTFPCMESVENGRSACAINKMYKWNGNEGQEAIDVFYPHTCTVLEDQPLLQGAREVAGC